MSLMKVTKPLYHVSSSVENFSFALSEFLLHILFQIFLVLTNDMECTGVGCFSFCFLLLFNLF